MTEGTTTRFIRVEQLARAAREASTELARAPAEAKNAVLRRLGVLLEAHRAQIVTANAKDMARATERGLHQAVVKRLLFDDAKITSRIAALAEIAALPDPVGQLEEMGRMANGITFGRMRVPLGVILMIYESRPHVTVNAGAFALKSGNAIILKGGSEARHCTEVLGRLWREAIESAGLPAAAVQAVSLEHEEVGHLLGRTDLLDLVIPRGGRELIRAVSEQSKVPVIKHYEGNCHVCVGAGADREMALRIILDSKLLMPAVCNAAESLVVDRAEIGWLPALAVALRDAGIEVRGCPEAVAAAPGIVPATEEDYGAEYLDLVYSLKVVGGIDEIIRHVNRYGSGHTDAVVTENYADARRFHQEVDSSVVLVNASTMFCDGQSLGLGAEVGISTDKLHARGPMGLKDLTSRKFVLWGDGQVMGR